MKIETVEQKLKEEKDKKWQEKEKIQQQILDDSNKQKKCMYCALFNANFSILAYFDKMEAKRQQALQKTQLESKIMDRENRKRHKSMTQKLEEAQKRMPT